MRCAIAQYEGDLGIDAVDRQLLRAQFARKYGAGDLAEACESYVDALPTEVSGVNVLEEYRLVRLREVATSLATRFASGDHSDETQELLDQYNKTLSAESSATTKDRLTWQDYSETRERLPIWPTTLENFLDGGVVLGHHCVVYARPDAGKSMFALNYAARALRSGYRVLYVANEEPDYEITKRLLSNMTDVGLDEMRHEKDAVRRAFKTVGKDYGNWTLLHEAQISLRDVERAVVRVKPHIVIVDQLQNLVSKEDNRVIQLDRTARGVREIAIKHNCFAMSITQAGDSADEQLELRMGDIDWSNTGIPAAVDLMLGIGVTGEWFDRGWRSISVMKNKVNGTKGHMKVYTDINHTRFSSKPGEVD
jgi:KaiC/GvpD/RAD55 family RecA-like ATPase